MRPLGFAVGLVSAALLAAPVGCGVRTASGPSRSADAIVVFAAASLKPAFTRIGRQFGTESPGGAADFEFAGSSELATQLTQGATADVFASADAAQMDTVAKAGLLAGDPRTFAANTLVIVTAPGNPKKIISFAGLAGPGLNVVICQRPVPCGSATRRIEDDTGVHLNPVSEELSVTDVLNKVVTGQADAGLVYVSDAKDAGGKVATVNFPEAAGAVNTYAIAVLKKAPHPAAARRFVDLVMSGPGQQVLAESGFAKP